MTTPGETDVSAPATGPETWRSPAWRAQALAWLDGHLALAGIERTGDVAHEQVRTWAAVLKIPTNAGPVWLKAAGPGTAFEIPLYPLLHQALPGAVLAPIAADPARGWIVLPDGGLPLGEQVSGPALTDALATLLPRYAGLQRQLTPRAGEVLAIGVPDFRPAAIPDRFAEVVALVETYVAQNGDADEQRRLAAVAGLASRVATWSAELTASPVPPSLDHSDLHPWNILIPADSTLDQATFFDWGDSVVAHPFTSLLVALRIVMWKLNVGADDPGVLRLRDAYLAAFSDLGSPADLIATAERACHLGKISRASAWATIARGASTEDAPEMYQAALAWLEMLLDDAYLGAIEE